jgi:hypothetical protein
MGEERFRALLAASRGAMSQRRDHGMSDRLVWSLYRHVWRGDPRHFDGPCGRETLERLIGLTFDRVPNARVVGVGRR